MSLLLLFNRSATQYTSTLNAGLSTFKAGRTQQTAKQSPAATSALAAAKANAIGKGQAAQTGTFSTARSSQLGKITNATGYTWTISRSNAVSHQQAGRSSGFTVSRTQQSAKQQSATNGLFLVSRTQVTSHTLTAQCAAKSAALTRLSSRSFDAVSAGFTAVTASIKTLLRSVSASLSSWSSSSSRATTKATGATLINAATVNKRTAKPISAGSGPYTATQSALKALQRILTAVTASWSGPISRQANKTVSAASLGPSGTVQRGTSHRMACVSSAYAGSATAIKAFLRTLYATTNTCLGTTARQTAQIANATSGRFSSVSTRAMSRIQTAVLGLAPTLARQTSRILTASANPSAATTAALKAFFRSISATASSFTTSIQRSVSHQQTANLQNAATTTKAIGRGIGARAAGAGAATAKGINKGVAAQTLRASVTHTAQIGLRMMNFAAALLGFQATQARTSHKDIPAARLQDTAATQKQTTRSWSAKLSVLSVAYSESRSFLFSVAASLLRFTGTQQRTIRQTQNASLPVITAQTTRGTARAYAVRLALAGSTLASRSRVMAMTAASRLFSASAGRTPQKNMASAPPAPAVSMTRQTEHTLSAAAAFHAVQGQGRFSLVNALFNLWNGLLGTIAVRSTRKLNSFPVHVQQRRWLLPVHLRAWGVPVQARTVFLTTGVHMISTTKDPGSTEDFRFDWSKQITNDSITASIWTLPSGLTSVNQSFDNATATVRISGGVPNQSYQIANRITLASGQILVRTMNITIEQS